MIAPERIWCQPTERRPVAAKDRKHAKWVRGNWKDHNSNAHGAREFVRADMHDATKGQLVKAVEALTEIIARWDTPAWKDVEPTAAVINRARAVLAEIEKGGV